jgi:hypothetical protein
MGTQTTKAKQSNRKKTTKKKSAALSTCPVGASGWCSYPFTVAQLEKRLKAKADEQAMPEEEKLVETAGRRSK